MEENKMDPSASSDQVVIIEEKISKVNGEIAIKRYSKGKMLGKGGFAKVYEVKNLETQKTLAGKIIMKNSLTKNRARQKLISEIKIHKSLHHHNVVNFEHVFEDQENVYILLELCSNQTLNELLKRRKKLHEIEVQCYVVQIICALKYLHSVRVIHRDLKLGNLFLNESLEIKIGDFGLATKLEFDGEKKRTICGTPNYIAPEVLDGKTGHSYEVDIWSLGVIIYTLLIGKPPFETPDVKTTYKKIKMNNYCFPEHSTISENAKNLITKILVLEPLKRPTLEEILLHPFINNGSFIPKSLPIATLACPPSTNWLKQFVPSSSGNPNLKHFVTQQQKMMETAPINQYNPSETIASNFKIEEDGSKWKKDSLKFNSTTKSPGLQSMKSLTNNFGSQNGIQSLPNLKNGKPASSSIKTEIWVKKWVDYSTKYGLGYLLTDGSTGVFFNDSTKLILHPKGISFAYYERRVSDKQEIISNYTITEYPSHLQKKVTLLQHFKEYLESEKNMEKTNLNSDIPDDGNRVYVKKWMKTKHAIMFRLSNKIVQVNFTDKSEIILSSENKMVTYLNKKGERSNYPLQTALESSNHEMAKRLKYTKEILTHMLKTNNADGGGNDQFNSGAGSGNKLEK